MKRPARKAFVLLVGVGMVLIAGCGGPSTGQPATESATVKKSKAIAAENIELHKQLQQCKNQIAKLNEQHSEEMQKQANLLETCLQEKEDWKKRAQQNIREQVKGVLETVMQENEKLREENKDLKTLVEQLQKEPKQGGAAEK
jgi:DNA repair exonuclease SbcCD ATPase subunit